jgi:hypothetical protein
MKTEFIQKLLYLLLSWLIQYLDGYHLRKNPVKRNVETAVTMNTEGKVVE